MHIFLYELSNIFKIPKKDHYLYIAFWHTCSRAIMLSKPFEKSQYQYSSFSKGLDFCYCSTSWAKILRKWHYKVRYNIYENPIKSLSKLCFTTVFYIMVFFLDKRKKINYLWLRQFILYVKKKSYFANYGYCYGSHCLFLRRLLKWGK